MALITFTDALILIAGWIIFMTYHEMIHEAIWRTAKARPKFILHPIQLFDWIATAKPKKLNDAEKLQCWNEIISYNALAFLIGIFCILLIVFK
jgi:hypothetical protein